MSEDRPNDEDYKWAISEGAMNESEKKMLTEEVLGECWHEKTFVGLREWAQCRKEKCNPSLPQRTFLTPDDLMAVKDAIDAQKRWGHFWSWALRRWYLDDTASIFSDEIDEAAFTRWLFRTVNEQGEPHFCKLAIDWWENKSA